MLEDRCVPASLNSLFVEALYQKVLDRPADSGQANWIAQLDNGSPRGQVALAFLQSAEHRTLQVRDYYQTYLHRDADNAGLSGFVQAFQNGASQDQVILSFVTSTEYLQAHPPADEFVQSLYTDLLGRTASEAELAPWRQALSALGTTEVARLIISSPENRLREVNALYDDYLGRAGDSSGLDGYLSQLAQGASWTSVGAGILGSDEFLQRNITDTNPPAPPPVPPGDILRDPIPVSTPPMVVQTVAGSLGASREIDQYVVSLQAGDMFTADVDTTGGLARDLRLSILDSQGRVIGTNDDAIDPRTNVHGSDPALTVILEQAGDYTIRVGAKPDAANVVGSTDYVLRLRRYALNEGEVPPPSRQTQDGSTTVWLTEDTLHFSDDEGNGIGLEGGWSMSETSRPDGLILL